MSNKSNKPGVAPSTMTRLVALLDGPATRSDLALTMPTIKRLVGLSLLKQQTRQGTRQVRKNMDETGKALRGRPAHLFILTDSGRKRVKRFAAQTA